MVAPGMKNMDGEAVAPLAGPLRWAVDVRGGASVRIAAAIPPLLPLRFSVAGPEVVLSENGNALPSLPSFFFPPCLSLPYSKGDGNRIAWPPII
jgi:hypothetical protein